MIVRRLLPAFLAPALLSAHMVSMSTGEFRIDGSAGHYELRIPTYEAAHVQNPERSFFEHIRFSGGGGDAKLVKGSCGDQQGTYICNADYLFPSPPDTLSVECTFASITVPNHVHMLRAFKGDKSDQAVFDLSFTSADVRFRPPTATELAAREVGAGFLRALEGAAPLLFLIALVLAARSRRELIALAGAFAAGETIALVIAPRFSTTLSPRFVEAAAALTVAYLALEIVLLPTSGNRWIVVGVLGLFHGAYFSLFLTDSGYRAPIFFAGVLTAQILALAILGLLLRRLFAMTRVVPVTATILLCTGLGWFIARVWG
ncbi:MAG TPA: HupE/UreJ family protein [Bryobacteraceae bacterium]|nr:HupE/UreJ family protein [Bryobacteraceae bacterium]